VQLGTYPWWGFLEGVSSIHIERFVYLIRFEQRWELEKLGIRYNEKSL
jgi:hypothetical protein